MPARASSRNATRLIAWIDCGVSDAARSYMAARHVQKSSGALPSPAADARCARPRSARWNAWECAVASAGKRSEPSAPRAITPAPPATVSWLSWLSWLSRLSLPHVARARAGHVEPRRPVPVPRGADDGRAVGGRHVLADLADHAQERSHRHRVRPDVVFAVARDEGPDDAEVLVAHRDAARVVVVGVGAEVPELDAPDAELQQRLPARPGRAALHDPEQRDRPGAPLVGLSLGHDGVVVAGAPRGGGRFVRVDGLLGGARRAGAGAARGGRGARPRGAG